MKPWIVPLGALAAVVLFARRGSAQGNADMGVVTSEGITPNMRDLALAIAHAEGFFAPNSIPKRAHNPGDLVIPGWTGATLGDQGISVFLSDADGWNRLYHQLDLIVRGKSHVYSLDDTFAEFGHSWTSTQSDAWTANVLEYLNAHGYQVYESSSIGEVLLS